MNIYTIIAWIEITIGGLGTFIFTFSILALFMAALGIIEGTPGFFILPFYVFFSLPFLLIFLGGIGLLKQKEWGRKVNLIGIPVLISLLALILIIFHTIGLIHFLTPTEDYYLPRGYNNFWADRCMFFLALDIIIPSGLIFLIIRLFRNPIDNCAFKK